MTKTRAPRATGEKKKRVRSVPLHLLYTTEERAEIRAACQRHRLLTRELVLEAVRAFRTLPERIDSLEARVAALEVAR